VGRCLVRGFVRVGLMAVVASPSAWAEGPRKRVKPRVVPKAVSTLPVLKSPADDIVVWAMETEVPVRWEMADTSDVFQFEVCFWKEGLGCDHEGTQRFFRANSVREATLKLPWNQKKEAWRWSVAACRHAPNVGYADKCRFAPSRRLVVDFELPRPLLETPKEGESFPPQAVGQTVPKIQFNWNPVAGATHYLLCIRTKPTDLTNCLTHPAEYGDGGDILRSNTNSVEWSTYLYTPPANCQPPCVPVPPEESRTYWWRAAACREVGAEPEVQCTYSAEKRSVIVRRAQ
jgi:hypothetical protein